MNNYIVCCPNCGSQDVKMVDYKEFECKCGEEFGMEKAVIEEVKEVLNEYVIVYKAGIYRETYTTAESEEAAIKKFKRGRRLSYKIM